MALSDQVAALETRLQTGTMSRTEFDQELALLMREAAGSSDTTRRGTKKLPGVAGMVGGPTPTHMGAYELVELLGQGGMGAVYLAKHLLKPGLFAVKVPRHEVLSQPGFGRRFRREASVGLKLDHPNIVRVHDLVIDGDWAAIVMDFVAGPNIETLLRNHGGPLPKARVLDLMTQVLDAMEYAHGQGVIHRDLKPKNLMMRPDGQVQVTDFGVAWLAGGEETQAGTGMVGTAPYMAPELYTGLRSIDQRADIYALGMTLYKLLVGQLPFPANMTSYQVLKAKEEGMVPMPESLPDALQDVIRKAVAPDPDERFGTCNEFKIALQHAGEADWSTLSGPMKIVHTIEDRRANNAPSPLQYAVVTLLVLVLAALTWLTIEVRREMAADEAPAAVAEGTANVDRPTVEEPSEAAEAAQEASAEASADETDDHRQRPADDWTIAAVSGGGLPRGTTPKKDEIKVKTTTPVRADSGALAIVDPTPAARTEPVTASPDPEAGGTIVRINPTPGPAPEPEAGLMYLSAVPDARVYIDDKDYGTTEQTRKGLVLAPGIYKVRFVCEAAECSGFERIKGIKTLEVKPGGDTRYVADIERMNRR